MNEGRSVEELKSSYVVRCAVVFCFWSRWLQQLAAAVVAVAVVGVPEAVRETLVHESGQHPKLG
jgi:hypothetical protein